MVAGAPDGFMTFLPPWKPACPKAGAARNWFLSSVSSSHVAIDKGQEDHATNIWEESLVLLLTKRRSKILTGIRYASWVESDKVGLTCKGLEMVFFNWIHEKLDVSSRKVVISVCKLHCPLLPQSKRGQITERKACDYSWRQHLFGHKVAIWHTPFSQ